MKPLKDQKVKEFETATFQCEVNKSNLKVKWLKNGEELKASKRIDFSSIDKKHILTIRNAEPTDQSEYTIIVEEGVESKAKLTVEGNEGFDM